MEFEIGASGQSLRLDASVIRHFDRNRQTRPWHREAGGLLFARFDLPLIDVVEATGPRRGDRRGRYSYSPDIQAERLEIEERFRRDLHFVGCWHTHPEHRASPSQVDIRNTAECVRRSNHGLGGFVMIIVGRVSIRDGLFVSVCDGEAVHRLAASKDAGPYPPAGAPLVCPARLR
ncbi:Mov34/MPN/PAD-1 family protein [Bradyrhizobium sp. RDM12]